MKPFKKIMGPSEYWELLVHITFVIMCLYGSDGESVSRQSYRTLLPIRTVASGGLCDAHAYVQRFRFLQSACVFS
jgi:hypothetical protein